ncbi:hypothetical protein [Streptomyces sp. NPDC096012]|uniref:hypothetical protein n=1 Tax=Streptomyces sp. NPDC096012 TaxID=3155684 RepID=UPI003369C926
MNGETPFPWPRTLVTGAGFPGSGRCRRQLVAAVGADRADGLARGRREDVARARRQAQPSPVPHARCRPAGRPPRRDGREVAHVR